MIIDIGATVVTRDRKKVGSVERVVLEPGTGELTHLVLHKGMILTRDKVVPISAVRRVANRTIYLDLTVAEMDGMPDFVETEYVVPQHSSATGPYVPGAVLWPTAYAYAPVVIREGRNIPQNAVDITEGTDVVCTDGKIGVVDEVVISEQNGEVVGLVVKTGLLDHRSGVIPVYWIERADSEEVRLNRSKKEIEEYFQSEDIRG